MNSHPLTELFSAVLALSWRAGWLIVVLAALRLAVRGRVPAQVWFVAWILVAARLLLPFSVPAGWSPYNLSPAHPLKMSGPNTETRGLPLVLESPPVAPEVPPVTVVPTAPAFLAAASVASAPAPDARPASRWTTTGMLTAIWLAGVAGLAAARLAGSWSFRRRLRGARPVTDARVVALVEAELANLAQQAGEGAWGSARLQPASSRPEPGLKPRATSDAGRRSKALVTLSETDAVDAPALYGFVRAQLLLPPGLAAKLSDDELRHVVRHELGHWRRRDLVAQALMQAAVVVHWFNPLAWLAARLSRADCELACDEFVLRREAPGGAGAYGATLLKVLGVVRGRRRPVAVVAMLEGKEQLTQRIRMIAGYRASTVGRVAGGVVLITTLAAASLTRETRAEDKAGITKNSSTPANSAHQIKPTPSSAPNASSGTLTLSGSQSPPSNAWPAPLTKTGTGTLTLSGNNTYTGVTTISAGTLQVSPTPLEPKEEAKIAADAERKARIQQSIMAFEALKVPADEQRRKVDQLQQALHDYKAKNGALSLDSRKDIVNETLKALNLEAVRVEQALNEKVNRLNQIKEYRSRRAPLTDLPFIANQPLIAQLHQQRVALQMRKELLADRYFEQHPLMKAVANELGTTGEQLERAIETACRQLEAEHQACLRQNEQVKEELAKQKQESLALDRMAVDYSRLERELKMNEQLLQTFATRALETAQLDATKRDPVRQGAGSSGTGEFTISVMGAVNQQGGIVFSENDKPIVLDAIARSGGFAPRADRNGVCVIRQNPDGSRSTLTLTEPELMKGAGQIGVLQRGDIVVVPDKPEPAAPGHVSVVGQVNKPGIVELMAGRNLTLVEAVARVGGPTRLANMKKVILKRTRPDGSVIVMSINLEELMKTDTTDSWPLQAGDVITVPERTI